MTVIWPASLPQKPLAPGYGETPRRPKVRFESDIGSPITRRKGTVKLSSVSMAMVMSNQQLDSFIEFVDENASGGDIFLFPHPRTEEQVTARLIGDEPYQIEPFTPYLWRVTFELLLQ